MLSMEFDLRREKIGGWSGGIVAEDAGCTLSFVDGNSSAVQGRKYVLMHVRAASFEFRLTLDRQDFPGLDRQTPLDQWSQRAMELLLAQLSATQLVEMLDRGHAAGVAAGTRATQESIKEALGLS